MKNFLKHFVLWSIPALALLLWTAGEIAPASLLVVLVALSWALLVSQFSDGLSEHKVVQAIFIVGAVAALLAACFVQSFWTGSYPYWASTTAIRRSLYLLRISSGGTVVVWVVCRLVLFAIRPKGSAKIE